MSTGVVDRLRKPEYTGENRCIPCTLVNTALAVLLAVGAAAGAAANWEVPVAGGLGAGVLAVSLGSIYVRGYLVPYTPALTKRYFPDRVLAWFDKAPTEGGIEAVDDGADAPVAGETSDLEPEPVLLEAGAIEICRGGEDLCPTDQFTAAWREEIRSLRDGGVESSVAATIGVDADGVAVEERDEYVLVRAEGEPVARWESYPALLADMAAYPLLSERIDDWADYGRRAQGSLLKGTRVFLESCPTCEGELAFSRDTVESCCRSIDVVALSCTECDARLLEVEA
ncbi:MAG: hypothetical protein V5A23_01615 [Halobacteriales archaeon]